jgi:hypothetical protein
MSTSEIAVALLGESAAFLTFLGVVVRGRWRTAWFFAAYLMAAATCEALVTLWLGRFWNLTFWNLKQAIYEFLKLGIAIEFARRIFRPFPGAQRVARRIAAFVMVATALTVVSLPPDGASPSINRTIFATVHPRIANGTIWLMLGLLGCAHWFRVPIHPFQSSVLTTFAIYLSSYGAGNALADVYGFDTVRPYLATFAPPAYALTILWWLHATWRRDEPQVHVHEVAIGLIQARTT